VRLELPGGGGYGEAAEVDASVDETRTFQPKG
jgi:N-methylhydantoinase B/oxoprolinase/acetone carboxylase alpha subunit